MGNSGNKFSQAFINSPILQKTKVMESNKDWTISDKVLTNRILIGCAKVISCLDSNHIKKMAESKQLFSQKNSALAYLLALLIITRTSTYQSAIHKMLKFTLTSVKLSDVNEFSNSIFRLGVKEKKKMARPKLKKGRPVDTGLNGGVSPGRLPILLEDSDYTEMLRKLLSRPIVRNLIYCYLFESSLLQQWFFLTLLLLFYRLRKLGPDSFAADTHIFHLIITDKNKINNEIQNLYKDIKALSDDKIRKKARALSRTITNRWTDEIEIMRNIFNYICMLGAFLYPFPIIVH